MSQLTFALKNKLLLPLFGVVLLICWFAAFGKTFDAIKMNHQLQQASEPGAEDLSFNAQYSNRKTDALDQIINSYKVKESQWSDALWLKSSSVAVKNKVSIDYSIAGPGTAPDSTAVGINQKILFYGSYTSLIKVIDTLEKIDGIGKISGIQIQGPAKSQAEGKVPRCALKIDFKAFPMVNSNFSGD
jgi:hypothetical protein